MKVRLCRNTKLIFILLEFFQQVSSVLFKTYLSLSQTLSVNPSRDTCKLYPVLSYAHASDLNALAQKLQDSHAEKFSERIKAQRRKLVCEKLNAVDWVGDYHSRLFNRTALRLWSFCFLQL